MTQIVLTDFIQHLSAQPWSNYTKADYTPEQWHNACLIHLHTGPPTSKSQCKLPVKTPNGALNKNGVFAAAAALAGARGGVNASPEQKAAAARKLRSYYAQMGAKPPPSLKQSNIQDFIDHHGVKGMHWGVRHPRSRVTKGKNTKTTYKTHGSKLTSDELSRRIRRMEMEKRYTDLNKPTVNKGKKFAGDVLSNTGRSIATGLLTGGALYALSKALEKKFGKGLARGLTGR